MRAVVQRVSSAQVRVDDRVVGEIGLGLLVFAGVEQGDDKKDVTYIASKVSGLRIFEDASEKMNLSVVDAHGALLVVSQFTLCGDCRKGRRRAFDAAAPPAVAKPLYEDLVRELRATGLHVETGEFQEHMHVQLVNAGPVTTLLDSRRRL